MGDQKRIDRRNDFRLGEWLVQPKRNCLVGRDKEVKLEPRVMGVLVYLAEHAGEVVSKDRIINVVWASSFVTDHVLLGAISTLRKALGDSRKTPRFIETIPKMGYCLIVPVQPCLSVEQEGGISQLGRWPFFLLAAAVLLLLVAGVVWVDLWRDNPSNSTPLDAVPLTSYPGLESSPTFSPDGTRVAFSWNGPGQDNLDIYVQDVGEAEPLRLTSDPAPDLRPAWSPDGVHIAFLRRESRGRVGLWLVRSSENRAERRLVEIDSLGGLSWSPNSKWVAVADRLSPEEPSGIFLVSVETRQKWQLTEPASAERDFSPSISPDGRILAFARRSGTLVSQIYLMGLSDTLKPVGEPKKLTNENEMCFDPLWTRDGRSIIFGRGTGANRVPFIVPVTGGEAQRVGLSGGSILGYALSEQNDRLAYVEATYDSDIWRAELGSDGVVGLPEKFISSTRWDASPAISPDCGKIVFVSERSGSRELWVSRSDGTSPRQLTFSGSSAPSSPAWSPDGQRIAYVARIGDNLDIYTIELTGATPRRHTTDPSVDSLPIWSEDGDWIYFRSNRNAGNRVWRIPVDGGEADQVTNAAGQLVAESPDGKYLYLTRRSRDGGQDLYKVLFEGSEEPELVAEDITNQSSSAVSEGIYFANLRQLNFLDFETGVFESLGAIPPVGFGALREVTVSPDRRWILMSAERMRDSDIMLVENFVE